MVKYTPSGIPATADEIRKQVDAIKSSIDELYNFKAAKKIKETIERKYAPITDDKWLDEKRDVLLQMEKVLESHKKAKLRNDNVLKQQEEMHQKDTNSGVIDYKKVGPEIAKRMGVHPFRWDYAREKYKPSFYQDSWSARDKLEAIKNHSAEPPETLSLIDNEYRRLTHIALLETGQEVQREAARLKSLIDRGADLNENEQKKYKTEQYSGIEETLIAGGKKFHDLMEHLGKGVFSRTDPKETEIYRKYLKKRNEGFTNFYKDFLGQKKQFLERHLKDLRENYKLGLVDEEEFFKLEQLMQQEMTKEDEQIRAVTEVLNKLNEEMYESVEKYTKEEDDMWKFRILQLALIVTPFMGLNMLGPLNSILSSVFGSGGFAHGVSSLATSEHTGFLGEIAEFLHLDKFIELVLTEVPIVSHAVDVIDLVAQSQIGQVALTGVAFPLLSGPLAQFGAAGLFSLKRFDTEAKHRWGLHYHPKSNNPHQGYKYIFQEHDKALKEQIERLSTEKAYNPNDFKAIVDQKFNILNDIYKKEAIIDFAAKLDEDRITKIFGDYFVQKLKDKGALVDGKINKDGFREMIVGNNSQDPNKKKESADIENKFLLFRSICRNAANYTRFDDMVRSYVTALNKDSLIKEEKEHLRRSFIFDTASENNIYYNRDIFDKTDKDPEKFIKIQETAAKFLEEQIKKDELKFMDNAIKGKYNAGGALRGLPSSKVRGGSCAPLDGNNLSKNLRPELTV